jgi:general secretion pathway protein H
MPHYQKTQGFTLLELMVTVAIMAIMAAIAFPSMRDFVSNSRLVNRSEQIANAFRFARTEAVRMNTPVLLCGVTIRKDGRPSGVCDETKISDGILIFADKDRNGKYDAKLDSALRTITLNGPNISASNKVSVTTETCDLAGTACRPSPSNTFVFLPNGMFGYKKTAAAYTANDYTNFVAQNEFGAKYIRLAVKDAGRTVSPVRYALVTPTGNAATCSPSAAAKDALSGDLVKFCTK